MPRSASATSSPSSTGSSDKYRILCGTCPDPLCKTKLHFLSVNTSVECTRCGQRHDKSALLNLSEAPYSATAFQSLLQNFVLGNLKPERGPENVMVHGLSNYVCKLLSPILSRYGMDRQTGRAKLLTEMGQGEIFDCGILSDRAFLLDPEHIDISGYGRDHSGSATYLADTLSVIQDVNDNDCRLIPIHADGDGHCLVHAVSRALVGRELFWHALRLNLMHHFQDNLTRYKSLFENFVDKDEWSDIIDECDPNFIPKDHEPAGLRNIHIFGLANVLHRPIILLDNLSGMQSSGDYSGVFLPALLDPEKCKGKDGTLNKPLCIAWSSQGRNHFIPLVGVKGKPSPRLPRCIMLQRAWGVSSSEIDKYIQFDEHGCCVVGGDKCLQDKYLQRLVAAMEEVFFEMHGVHPALVADVHHYSFKSSGFAGAKPEMVIEETMQAVQEHQLFRCLTCEALTQFHIPRHMLIKGGSLYNLAINTHKELFTNKLYSFPTEGITCRYDKLKDELVPDMNKLGCPFCRGDRLRLVRGDCSIEYKNKDRTLVPAGPSSRCHCGFKHYWEGNLYDNLPEMLEVPLEWNGKKIEEKVAWFQCESDPQLNSNVYKVADDLVQKHFPGEFGSERLVQKVVDTLLRQTAVVESALNDKSIPSPSCEDANDPPKWTAIEASKIILSGSQKKSLHKEELIKSETELQLRQKISTNAPLQQSRKSLDGAAVTGSTKKSTPFNSPIHTVIDHKLSQEASVPGTAKISSSSILPSAPKSLPSEKKIRVATSDGKMVMLTLSKEVTHAELQQKIFEAVGVLPRQQKLRIGFPPHELKPPPPGEENKMVPIVHGDKISLEILPDSVLLPSTGEDLQGSHWGLFDRLEHMPNTEAILDRLKDSQHGDSIDSSIMSLNLIAAMSGKDLWTHVQKEPHLFSVGGLFYKQVERDLGLSPNKHCTLPSLPGKVFTYNPKEDRLELCLEPHGHFAVRPDIEKLVSSGSMLDTNQSAQMSSSSSNTHAGGVVFGTSGVVSSRTSSHGQSAQRAFQGQGHSLRSSIEETRMPTDIPMTSGNRREARRLHNFCDPGHNQESIEEETETVDVQKEHFAKEDDEKFDHSPQVKYIRKGPGFSVLEPQVPMETDDAFRRLVKQIETTMSRDIEQDERIYDKLEEDSNVETVGSENQKEERLDLQEGPIVETVNSENPKEDKSQDVQKDSIMETVDSENPKEEGGLDLQEGPIVETVNSENPKENKRQDVQEDSIMETVDSENPKEEGGPDLQESPIVETMDSENPKEEKRQNVQGETVAETVKEDCSRPEIKEVLEVTENEVVMNTNLNQRLENTEIDCPGRVQEVQEKTSLVTERMDMT